MTKARRDVGIEERHTTSCASRASRASRAGKRCNCAPRYRGHVKDSSGRKIRSHWTASKAEAIAWRQEAVIALRQGRLRPPTPTTVKEGGDALVVGKSRGVAPAGVEPAPSRLRAGSSAVRLSYGAVLLRK